MNYRLPTRKSQEKFAGVVRREMDLTPGPSPTREGSLLPPRREASFRVRGGLGRGRTSGMRICWRRVLDEDRPRMKVHEHLHVRQVQV